MPQLKDNTNIGRAKGTIAQWRPTRWVGQDCTIYTSRDGDDTRRPDPTSYVMVGDVEEVWNVKTKAGIDFTFDHAYGSSPGGNGLNYIALSDDAVTETVDSTTLSNEIAANGLNRQQGTYAHTPGAATATIAKLFICTTAPQAAKKAALFSAGVAGAMQHVLPFTERSLQVGDALSVTFTITLS